jgi:nucleotide-binding universal stress UspA family protein
VRERRPEPLSYSAARNCRKPLLGYNGSPAADRALEAAIDIASAGHGRLTILSAAEEIPYLAHTDAAPEAIDELKRTLLRDAELALELAVAQVPRGIPVTKILCPPPIRPALLAEAERGPHDLLVLGSPSRGPLGSLVHRSLAKEIVRRSPIPVLIADTGSRESGRPERSADAPVPSMRVRRA